jgi:hypothetical protein
MCLYWTFLSLSVWLFPCKECQQLCVCVHLALVRYNKSPNMVLHAELDLYGCVIRSESVTRQSLVLSAPVPLLQHIGENRRIQPTGNQGKPISLSIKCYVRLSWIYTSLYNIIIMSSSPPTTPLTFVCLLWQIQLYISSQYYYSGRYS